MLVTVNLNSSVCTLLNVFALMLVCVCVFFISSFVSEPIGFALQRGGGGVVVVVSRQVCAVVVV